MSTTPQTYDDMTTSAGLRERAEDNLGIDEIKEFLQLQGYEELGEGSVGTVFAKPGDDTVLKVARKHDTWMMIAREQLKSGYKNPHLQTVHALHIFKDGYVARRERLESHHQSARTMEVVWAGDDWLRHKIRGQARRISKDLTGRQLEALTFCLNATASAPSRCADLHADNLMMRGRVRVFIDPIHGEGI